MNTEKPELEQAFLGLPNLKHVGMALIQFLHGRSNITNTHKAVDENGLFHLGFVAFSFPKESEIIRMYVNVTYPISNTDIPKHINTRFLPLKDSHPFPSCDITKPIQLLCAAWYIELAYSKYLGTRQTSSSPFDPISN
jgi:hypothetical protein